MVVPRSTKTDRWAKTDSCLNSIWAENTPFTFTLGTHWPVQRSRRPAHTPCSTYFGWQHPCAMASMQRGGRTRKPRSHFGTPVGDVKRHIEHKLVKCARRSVSMPCMLDHAVRTRTHARLHARLHATAPVRHCVLSSSLYEHPTGFLSEGLSPTCA